MSVTAEAAPAPPSAAIDTGLAHDHRGSWVPSGRMIQARFHELRRRRGLMIGLALVTIGIPVVYVVIRMILHAASPHTYGPAGGYDTYTGLVTFPLYVFGFIVAATLGATAGSIDLTEGMFRHHVITGRSRVALYLARIPAGLAIIWSMMLVGFAVVCTVCVFAAPTTINYNGASVPAGLSEPALEQWAVQHPNSVLQNFPPGLSNSFNPVSPGCVGGFGPGGGPGPIVKGSGPGNANTCTPAQLKAQVIQFVKLDYSDYKKVFLTPPFSLMVKTGLWLGLEAAIGFLIGLGLSSLIGQRTVSAVLLIILEIIITPIAFRAHLPHMINLQRSIVGIATAHVEPGNMPIPFGGGSLQDQIQATHETTTVAVIVILAWAVVWTALGAWRMATRDT